MERTPKADERRPPQKAPGADRHDDGDKEHVKQAPGRSKSVSDEDKKLNEALEESFPASDPPTGGQITGREKPKSRIDRQPAPVVAPTPDSAKK